MIKTDTIIALATPPGIGAISVIRLSGIDSIIISNKLFKALNNLDLISQKTHSINLGYIMDSITIIDKSVTFAACKNSLINSLDPGQSINVKFSSIN